MTDVAVTGLPYPQADHATRMCGFAKTCLSLFATTISQLGDSLGPGTTDLALRVGIHSGPVTGGVLRGLRGRFQLFGDAMNTASRMETNSKKNQIHVSQETADLLMKAGKESWLQKREDKIIAKGKGQMETYWLRIGSRTSATGMSGDSQDELITGEVVRDIIKNIGQEDHHRPHEGRQVVEV